jgi:anti-sigma B factor antagonist
MTYGDLDYSLREVGRVHVLDLRGELTLHNANELKELISSMVEQKKLFVLINLENVQGIDSSGLSAFVAGQTYLTRQKGQLKLAAARPAIRKLLKATLLDQLLAVFDSVDEAMRSFPAR